MFGASSHAPVPTSLLPCWVQTAAAAGEDPRRPDVVLSPGPPTMAVLPSADSATEKPCRSGSNRAGADQLAALLGPDAAAAGKDPRRSGVRVVVRPAHDGGVAVGGQRDGGALRGSSNRAGADQLRSLLGPDAAAAGEDPRRPSAPVVA